LNKNTKIWLNYLLGGIISLLLLWGIYLQVQKQLHTTDISTIWQTGPSVFLWLCLLLMPVNLLLEGKKWHLLAGSAQTLSYRQAFSSYLAGIAISIVTPYRIGEYPGRILYLKRKNTFRLISVSILGSVAQMFTVFAFGLLGLIYYNMAFPGKAQQSVLIISAVITIIILVFYFTFERWLPLLERFRWMRRLNIYGQLLKRFSRRDQIMILLISIVRYVVFAAQYLFLLRWMNVYMPLTEGFYMVTVFYWAIAIIPTIALAELGERGQVSLFLFHHFSSNTVGILAATMGIWLLNLIVPAVLGSFLLFRMRILK
jgi:hypothetical protein